MESPLPKCKFFQGLFWAALAVRPALSPGRETSLTQAYKLACPAGPRLRSRQRLDHDLANVDFAAGIMGLQGDGAMRD
jgi:hypothetical protein